MNYIVPVALFLFCVLCVIKQQQCAKILAILPTASYSHQIPYRPLWLELHKRGHEIVLITTDPIPNMNRKNFTQINISQMYKDVRGVDFVKRRFEKADFLTFVEENMLRLIDIAAQHILNNTDVKRLYAPNSNEHFDLVFAEMLLTPSVYAFAHRFNAPLIGLSSLGLLTLNEHALGGLVLPSHEYTWEMEANIGTHQPFWKRLQNFVKLYRYMYFLYSNIFHQQQKLVEKYFERPLPPLLDILKNTSLIFVNQADALTAARPKLANMIMFTSFHVKEKLTPLPQDLKRFLDQATEGCIYFSLGSNAMSSSMPKETLQVFLDVFDKLPYKVVWKYEKEPPVKRDNIFFGKWLPQQSILAHPNIKMFIYQGGLQSTEEAVHFTVPLLGLPVLADQDYQVLRMEALRVAIHLEITTITREELEGAILELINNKQYKEKMIELKKVVNDNPYDLVEHLAWWTEYVIRHKGAPHFRSTLADQPWYQRCDMDIVVFLTIVAVLVVSKTTSIIATLVVRSYKRYRLMSTRGKRKMN
ncbi:UDP-glucosyltransferase 2-like [Nomia melanderi]|uniref:UDP-glucosyltransferase 2-like n=1 Tax=Nomia melanderi TaxID=2448451 RepID=UPI001304095F|nr:UDP-glucuronosyltransferase 2B13-like [Nomia melanderi]